MLISVPKKRRNNKRHLVTCKLGLKLPQKLKKLTNFYVCKSLNLLGSGLKGEMTCRIQEWISLCPVICLSVHLYIPCPPPTQSPNSACWGLKSGFWSLKSALPDLISLIRLEISPSEIWAHWLEFWPMEFNLGPEAAIWSLILKLGFWGLNLSKCKVLTDSGE